jgi:hypothetical protein
MKLSKYLALLVILGISIKLAYTADDDYFFDDEYEENDNNSSNIDAGATDKVDTETEKPIIVPKIKEEPKPTDASVQTTIITSSSETKAKPEEASVDNTDTTPVVKKAENIPVEKRPDFPVQIF